ncbi:hypothetical protein TNCV_2582821 [Trichonephila clavipes]|nr:hypothetical protein TNCV_2582821 [Trichonephila clavipes]
MKKKVTYKPSVQIRATCQVISATCTCPAGGTPAFCKHAFALLHAINDYIAKKLIEEDSPDKLAETADKKIKFAPLPIDPLTRMTRGGYDDNVCTVTIAVDTDILEFVLSSKNTLDANSNDENEMNNAPPVPKSSEMGNVMKSLRNYLDSHSNGEMNNKMDDIDQFIDSLMLKKERKGNYQIIFQKLNK